MKKQRHYFLPLLLLIITAAVVAYSFVQRNAELERYERTDSILHQLIELDTRLDKDILLVLSFQLTHFDGIVETVSRIRELQKEMQGDELSLHENVSVKLGSDFDKYLERSKLKISLMERLKSRTAALKNTLRYLPKAITDFDKSHETAASKELTTLINLLLDYNIFPQESLRDTIKTRIAALHKWPASAQEKNDIENILFHTSANLRFRESVNTELTRYSNIPITSLINNIRQEYDAVFLEQRKQSYNTNLVLFVIAFMLLMALAQAMRSLRKEQEIAEHAHDRLHDAIESISEAFALYDKDDKLVLWNSKFEHFYPRLTEILHPGISHEKIIRHGLEQEQFQLEKESREECLARMIANHREGAAGIIEEQSDKRSYLASDNKTSDGGTTSVRVDITKRRIMEEKLRELSVAVEQSPVSIVITDLQGGIEYVNPKFEQVTGYNFEEVRGKNPSILKSGNKKPEEYRDLWETIKSGHEWRGEFLNKKKNGEEYWETAVITSITDVNGKPIHYLAVKEDITERRRAEERLRMSDTVFNTSTEAIMVSDARNRIKAVNPSFTRITGYTPEEILGKDPSILSSGRHDDTYYRAMWESLKETGSWQGEIWNRRKNGDVYPEWLSLATITDDSGVITEYVAVFSDITKRKEAEEKIHWQANFDTLTKLPNRTLFFDRLTRTIVTAQRNDQLCALLFIDLDRFKVVNDTLGHTFGDKLLKEVAERIKDSVREVDTVARLGGDEFTVILQNITSEQDAAHIAAVVIKELSRAFIIDNHEIYIGASIGITIYPNDADDATTMIRNADMSMYRAKEAGRNAYRFYTQEMNEQMLHRMRIENDMRVALDHDELFLEFQPIVDQKSETVVSAEALVRWNHPELGRLPPNEFISIAEESGLIARLGEWVLHSAVIQASQWQAAGLGNIAVSVNISSQQLKLGLSKKTIETILSEIGLDPVLLNLEITESLLIEDTSEALAWLDEFKQMGLKLYVDDFGTGYSSLSYLKQFPVDLLKIDKSFVRDLSTDPDDATLVEAIITLAHSFNLKVVAEGVETHEQLDFLRKQQCDLIQGFHYSRPLSSADFIDYVKQVNNQASSTN